MPKGKTIIHSTLDPNHLNKDVEARIGLVGDAGLVLDALLEEIGKTVTADRDASAVAAEIAASHKEWLAKWMPKLTSNDAPLNPYRVLWDLQHTVDINNTIITHDAGSPRDQLSPFWKAVEPLSYLGWGKTTQLGYGLGLAMGAKLAKPDKLCINVWGDAAIGFTGMDFETAVRERIPIMSILLNNFSMAIELKVMPISTEKYRSTDISGDYAAMARAFGGYGERVTKPEDIIPAIKRGIQKTQGRHPGAAGVHHQQGDRGVAAGHLSPQSGHFRDAQGYPGLTVPGWNNPLPDQAHCEPGAGGRRANWIFGMTALPQDAGGRAQAAALPSSSGNCSPALAENARLQRELADSRGIAKAPAPRSCAPSPAPRAMPSGRCSRSPRPPCACSARPAPRSSIAESGAGARTFRVGASSERIGAGVPGAAHDRRPQPARHGRRRKPADPRSRSRPCRSGNGRLARACRTRAPPAPAPCPARRCGARARRSAP